jgi:hypothetical protein
MGHSGRRWPSIDAELGRSHPARDGTSGLVVPDHPIRASTFFREGLDDTIGRPIHLGRGKKEKGHIRNAAHLFGGAGALEFRVGSSATHASSGGHAPRLPARFGAR